MQTALIALEIAGSLNHINIDSRGIVKEFALEEGKEPSIEILTRIAKRQGFRVSIKKLPIDQLVEHYPMPIICLMENGKYETILKADKNKRELLVYDIEQKKPALRSYDEFEKSYAGKSLVLKHRMFAEHVRFGFGWFVKEVLSYKKIIFEVLMASFVIQLFGLVTPLFTQVILDKVLVHHSISTLDVLAIAFLVVTLFDFLLNYMRNYVFVHTTSKIDAKLGAKLYHHLLSLPFGYFVVRQVGNIIARVRELEQIRSFIANKSITLLLDVLFSFVFLAVMFLYSVQLALMVMGFVFLIAIIYFFATPNFRKRLDEKFNMGAEQNAFLVESVTGVETVKSLALEGSMQKRWEDKLADYVTASFNLSNFGFILGGVSGMLQKLMTISILYFGVLKVINGDLTVGQLIAFQMFANQFSGPVLRLVNLWNEFQQTLLSVDRLGDILNTPAEQKDEKAITLSHIRGDISFQNVNFSYKPGGALVLKNLTFSIKAGMSVGIIGRSGSGKSTIAKMIQRLYIPNEGVIYVDGVDIRHFNPKWYRNMIGIVLQESFLFRGTIKENIAMARPDASMDQIITVAKISGAHQFISELPEGYDTDVGERGTTLSGGQRQRVAIARALLTNPRILIFDEATSALDFESEKIINANIAHIKKGRTTIIIAHRLSTVKDCDVIIAMDKGQIVEAGKHEDLMKKKGYYYHLYTQQEL
ncbi:MAG: type I secretion system permease/ATPase [Campylobacteraceae bacterium 4484_4]|nr:MAG: type I secretion system permease/ATPase [Campylobacteraceae bacterium 4484_4]